MTLGLFVDTANIYFCVGKRFGNRKLDYQKVWDRVSEISPIFKAYAYGIQMKSEAAGFISCLEKIGFYTRYKHPEIIEDKIIKDTNWNVGLTLDIISLSQRVNTVVICSSDIELIPTLQWLRDNHLKTFILACGISSEAKSLTDHWIEITEDLLETRTPKV